MAIPFSTSFDSESFPGHLRLGPDNFDNNGLLTSIGYFGGQIGLRPYAADDLRLPIVGLSAVDLQPDQVTQIVSGGHRSRAILAQTTFRRMGMHDPGQADILVASAWRNGAIHSQRTIELSPQAAPGLQYVPLSVKRIIGCLLRGQTIAEIQAQPEFVDVPVTTELKAFKDSLNIRTNAAVLSFGMLALRKSSQQAAPTPTFVPALPPAIDPPKPKAESKPSENTRTKKIHTLPHPKVHLNEDNIAFTEMDGMTISFDIADRLSAPRSITRVVHCLLGLNLNGNSLLHEEYRVRLRSSLDLAYADFGMDYAETFNSTGLLTSLIHAGDIRFIGKPQKQLTNNSTDRKYLRRICEGASVDDIASSLPRGIDRPKVAADIVQLRKKLGARNLAELCLRSYTQGLVPIPEAAQGHKPISNILASPLPEKPDPPLFDRDLVYWAGGVLKLCADSNISFGDLKLLVQHGLDLSSSQLVEQTGLADSPQIFKSLQGQHKLPTRLAQSTAALFDRGWVCVAEKAVPSFKKLYPQEQKVIDAFQTFDVDETVRILGYSHNKVEHVLRGCKEIFGAKTTHGLVAMTHLTGMVK